MSSSGNNSYVANANANGKLTGDVRKKKYYTSNVYGSITTLSPEKISY